MCLPKSIEVAITGESLFNNGIGGVVQYFGVGFDGRSGGSFGE